RREPAPGFSVGERRHESAPRLARTVTRARDAARKSGAASAIEDIAFAVARSAAFPDALPGPARRGVAFARTGLDQQISAVGCAMHFVSARLDAGVIVEQGALRQAQAAALDATVSSRQLCAKAFGDAAIGAAVIDPAQPQGRGQAPAQRRAG